jgi:translocation and assembly module TamB
MLRRHRIPMVLGALLVGLPIALCATVLLLANTDAGRRLIERSTARLTDGKVLLAGLSGRFPGRLSLSQLQLSDPQGVWLTADDLQLDWSPLPLIERHLRIGQLTVARVSLPRAPAYTPSATPGGQRDWWLHALRIDRLDVARLDLGAALAGQPVAVRLQGSARIGSWNEAAGQLTARRLDELPATYRVLAQLDRRRARVQVDVQEDADGPLSHLVQLPALGALDLHLAMEGPRDAVATELRVRGGALQASAAGSVNLDTGSATLQLALQAPAMSPRPDLSWRRLSMQGSWSGTLAAPTSSATLALDSLTSGDLQLDTLRAELHGDGAALALDATLGGLVLPAPVRSVLADAPLQLHARARLGAAGRPVEFTLSHALLSAQGNWNAAGANAGSGSISARLNDLAPLARIAGLDLHGSGAVQAQLSGKAGAHVLTLTSGLDVAGGDESLDRLLAPRASLAATLTFADGAVAIERAQLTAAKLTAAVHGRDVRGALALDYQMALADLTALSPALAGRADAEGQLQGSTPRLTLSADVRATLSVHGSPPGALELSLRAHDLPLRPDGQLELNGTLDRSPLRLALSAQRQPDGSIAARIEHGAWKSAQLSGALQIDSRNANPQGRLQLQIARLQDFAALLGQPLQGSVEGSVVFEHPGAHSRAQIALDTHDLVFGSQPLQLLQLRGEIAEPLLRPVLALQLNAQAQRGATQLKLDAQLHGRPANLRLHADGSVQTGDDPALQLQAAAALHLERRELRLMQLRAQYRAQTLQLLAPTTLSFEDGLVLAQTRLGVGSAALEAAGRLTPTLDLRASLRAFEPALLRALWPGLPAEGRVDADAALTGTLATPLGSVTLQAHALRASAGVARGLPALDIDASATLQPQTVQLQLQMHAGDGLQLTGKGELPLNRTAPMAFDVSGSFNLNVVNPITEASGQRMLGKASIDAALSGTLTAPQARGTLVISGGDLQDYPRGTHLSDVSATLAGDGEQLELKQFTAHAGKGTLSASGTLGLAGELPVALQVTARGARPFASDLLTATIDLDLKLSGAWRSRLRADGDVKIDRADINIPNAMPPDVAVLNVVRPGQGATPPAKAASTSVDLDLRVSAARAVFVRGRGITAELGGKLHIQGSSADPDISGSFELSNGANSTVNLAGTTLTFSSGRLGFDGSGVKKRIDPTLDFTATTLFSGDSSATLNVGGYADAPVITLSSVPEMPQDEILAHLLFGVSVTQLSPLQLAQIGVALASIGGVGGGFNPLNAVQRKLGLDRLAISGGSNAAAATGVAGETSNAATIEAGRYVTRRVYIGAKQSTNGAAQAQVQVDLTKSLKLNTALGTGGTVQGATPQNDPGSSLGLSYQFEY